MQDAFTLFPPTASAARMRLGAFAPHAGKAYAQMRNFDLGAPDHKYVSMLSPYLRLKVLDEADVSQAVLSEMEADAAEKFLMEVWWRTYWKGWMEQRPAVWTRYCADLARLNDDVQTEPDLRQGWDAACNGTTGIAAFDHWAQELIQTGYLHNHARMWFASIWIFTLNLPWQLGADFFLRHLLDGDAAVNTLSWRWVAGIQTQGKTYLADAANIAKYTGGRFATTEGLATHAVPVTVPEAPARQPITEIGPYNNTPGGRAGLLLHSDDICADWFLDRLGISPAATAYLDATAHQSPWTTAPVVNGFRNRMVQDISPEAERLHDGAGLAQWAAEHNLDHIVAPHAPVGAVRDLLTTYRAQQAVPLSEVRREIDTAAWPLATAGFFKFRGHIPDLLDQFAR